MSQLSKYRASLKRLIEGNDDDAAFQAEGFDAKSATLVRASKSFKASRSASRSIHTPDDPEEECGGMSQRQK